MVHFAPDHINMYHTKLLTTDCACQQTPYPCIGLFRFLELDLHRMSIYPEILERVRTGDKFLDLGCALGQELRHLVSIHTNPKANSPPPRGKYSTDKPPGPRWRSLHKPLRLRPKPRLNQRRLRPLQRPGYPSIAIHRLRHLQLQV